MQTKLKSIQKITEPLSAVDQTVEELSELVELCANDEQELASLLPEVKALESVLAGLEFQKMFDHPMDPNPAFFEIQSGSGGTEAQDWAEILYRMYSRWFEKKGFKVSVLDWSPGDVAGIKGCVLRVEGPHAFGWLRTETGIHRLVRKSPFDSGNRRHTSFAAVFVSPEIDDNIEVDINPADLRVDTYRSSGAGGQHVNTTDSAVRITHLPTQIVVQCQSERSQHQNKARAMAQLKARLYEHLRQQQVEESQAQAQAKDDITWGRQIRSYVLDQSRIKDLRTGFESGHPQGILDGDLDGFVEASLKQGVGQQANKGDNHE